MHAHILVDCLCWNGALKKTHKKVSVKEPHLPAPLGVVQPTAIPARTAYARSRSTLHTAAMQPRQTKKSKLLLDACIRCIADTTGVELVQASSWPCVSWAQRQHRPVRRRQEPASHTRGQAVQAAWSPPERVGVLGPGTTVRAPKGKANAGPTSLSLPDVSDVTKR